MIGDAGNDRRDHDRRRNSGGGQFLDGVKPALRRRGARLHGARQFAVERRHRERDLGQSLGRHRPENVEIAQNQRRFGDDGDWMIGVGENLQDRAHDAMLTLDWLVGIGIGADGDGFRLVMDRRQFAPQQVRGVVLDGQAALEIKPGDRPR